MHPSVIHPPEQPEIVLQRDFFTELPRTPLAQAFERALAMGEIDNMVAALVVLDYRQGGVGIEPSLGQDHVEQLAGFLRRSRTRTRK